MFMQYEAVIGLEVHVQMLTESKIFCGCSTKFGQPPNTQTCPICIGMPGVLPVLNKKAIEFTIKTGLAMNCNISKYSRFARKNYFYPDLPKAYQISQYELPICENGYLEVMVDGKIKRIGITRIHLEEDAGKNIHKEGSDYSFVDFNRAGTPLMEIVSEPDIRSHKEAIEYMKKLRTIVRYLDVCDGNMEQGSLRCDVNISLHPIRQKEFGVKTELKNINSFKFVEKAIMYEIKRQTKILQEGKNIIQETRLFDSTTGITKSMRSKEDVHDYRYFPEPDLVPIIADEYWLKELESTLPELQDDKLKRFISNYQLSYYDADILTSERPLADWFEQTVKFKVQPKSVINWIMTELTRFLNEDGKTIEQCLVTPCNLAQLIKLIDSGIISNNIAKTVFSEMYKTGNNPEAIIKQRGLIQISDITEIEKVIDEVITKNPKEVERLKQGEEKLIGFFVGQIMKFTKGKANPQLVNELLNKKLKG